MKTNKNKLSINEQFCQDMKIVLGKYYREALSESIKKGLAQKKKRLSTRTNLQCKAV